jgi:hypothetical protein
VFSFLKEFAQQVKDVFPQYHNRLLCGKSLYSAAIATMFQRRETARPDTARESQPTKYHLFVAETPIEDFQFPIQYLIFICGFCHQIIDEFMGTKNISVFSYNQKEWTRSRNALIRYLSQQQMTSVNLPTFQTPSSLLIFEILKLEVILCSLHGR